MREEIVKRIDELSGEGGMGSQRFSGLSDFRANLLESKVVRVTSGAMRKVEEQVSATKNRYDLMCHIHCIFPKVWFEMDMSEVRDANGISDLAGVYIEEIEEARGVARFEAVPVFRIGDEISIPAFSVIRGRGDVSSEIVPMRGVNDFLSSFDDADTQDVEMFVSILREMCDGIVDYVCALNTIINKTSKKNGRLITETAEAWEAGLSDVLALKESVIVYDISPGAEDMPMTGVKSGRVESVEDRRRPGLHDVRAHMVNRGGNIFPRRSHSRGHGATAIRQVREVR